MDDEVFLADTHLVETRRQNLGSAFRLVSIPAKVILKIVQHSVQSFAALFLLGFCCCKTKIILGVNTLSDINKKLGRNGEQIAVDFLKNNGFDIVKQNFYGRFGEIDIIARDKNDFVFVEVKTRKNNLYGNPCESVSFIKQEKIKKTALEFISKENLVDKNFRFDVIEIILDKKDIKINHIENAFDF